MEKRYAVTAPKSNRFSADTGSRARPVFTARTSGREGLGPNELIAEESQIVHVEISF